MTGVKSLDPYSHIVVDGLTYAPSEIDFHTRIPEKILRCLELEELPFSELNLTHFPKGWQNGDYRNPKE
jgi:hypothetical protein